MSNLTPGCLALVINGYNSGKVVTVGNKIGFIEGFVTYHGENWEVDKPMITEKGKQVYFCPEKLLSRIDDGSLLSIKDKTEVLSDVFDELQIKWSMLDYK